MENTAHRLTAQEIIKEAQETHGNLDLLRVFLITNSADIIREYEFISKLNKYSTNAADKVIYENALKTLINVSLKRIELTDILYNASNSINAISALEPEETKTIMMLPSLEDILARVTVILTEGTDKEGSKNNAFELLKTTVGQGKVLNSQGKPETWDNEDINAFITEIIDPTPFIEGTPFAFKTCYDYFTKMIENGKEEPEIKEALKVMLIGKIIKGSTEANDYFIKDETVFEDYYTRIISNVVLTGIIAFKQKSAPVVDKATVVAQKIEEEVKPLLAELDKDETQSSFTPVTKKVRDIYQTSGFKISLMDALLKAKEYAEALAPNLIKRNKEASKSNVPVTPIVNKEPVVEGPVEIYDESHNIQESNKSLWEKVEKYEYLDQLFTKGVELAKAGFWRDALSMSIILISSGKIKESETSTEVLKWDTDQIKLWYYNVVEASVNTTEDHKTTTVDTVAEIITDKTKVDEISGQENSETTAKSSESSSQHEKEIEKVKDGPVPQAGSIDSKENLSRLLKDNTLWKDTYKFKSFLVKTDHHRGGAMSLEIVDATEDQEKDLLIIESNMTKFFDGLRDTLVESKNAFPEVKKIIMDRLSPFYEISNSEVKRIVGNLAQEADAIRKEAKKASKIESSTETILEVADQPNTEKASIPPVIPVVEKTQDVSTENSETENTETGTETTAGKDTISSNKETMSYEGFEDIVKSRNKLDLNKAIFAKASEYSNLDEGIKAVFTVVDAARKDHHYKKSQIRNWKPTPAADLLSAIQRIVITGAETVKNQ